METERWRLDLNLFGLFLFISFPSVENDEIIFSEKEAVKYNGYND